MFEINAVTTPHQTDCGATCLKMLLDFYGTQVEIETLQSECRVDVNGSTMSALKRVGNAHGLDLHAYNMDAQDLITRDRPGILWWRYCHFVVYGGVDDAGKVVLYDPDRGRYRMSADSFSKLYAGKVMFNGEPGELVGTDPVDTMLDALEEAIGSD